jgi:hypothetical protein
MRILKTWLRLLLGSRDQSVNHEVRGKVPASCFEAWIRAYRQRLENDRSERPAGDQRL